MKYTILVLLAGWLILPGKLINEAQARASKLAPRNTANRVPVDYERSGADPGYIHGKHCIDGRTF